jgi:hypothetical protein
MFSKENPQVLLTSRVKKIVDVIALEMCMVYIFLRLIIK